MPPLALKGNEALRAIRVRQLFEAQSTEEHAETEVLLFYAWLEKLYVHLLPSGSGDPYQRLKADLTGLFK